MILDLEVDGVSWYKILNTNNDRIIRKIKISSILKKIAEKNTVGPSMS